MLTLLGWWALTADWLGWGVWILIAADVISGY